MSELQQNRYDQLIRRVGGIVGPGSKVSEALGELFPVIDVERVPGELLALMGTGTAWGYIQRAAVGSQFSRCALSNPEGSGKIITVTSLSVRVSAGNQLVNVTVIPGVIGGAAIKGAFRDLRIGIGTQPVADIRAATNVAALPQHYAIRGQTGVLFVPAENGVCVLAPGTQVVAETDNVNIGLNVGWTWRERAAEPSELSL